MVLLYDIYFPTSYLFYTTYYIIPIKYTMVCLSYRFKKKKEVRRDAKKKGDEIQIVLKIYIFTNENNNNELQIIFIINFEKICYI